MSRLKSIILWLIVVFLTIPYGVTYLISGSEMNLQKKQDNKEIEVVINNEVKNIELGEYVIGVVANEIPTDFSLEAIKAQVVIVRTRLQRDLEREDDITYTYLNYEQIIQKWRFMDIADVMRNLEAAVSETSGLVLKYEGELIIAPYHYSNDGATISGEEGFGSNGYPYLQSVECGLDALVEGTATNHGMGMSQYTAHYMALEGKSFEEILKYFYRGVEIIELD